MDYIIRKNRTQILRIQPAAPSACGILSARMKQIRIISRREHVSRRGRQYRKRRSGKRRGHMHCSMWLLNVNKQQIMVYQPIYPHTELLAVTPARITQKTGVSAIYNCRKTDSYWAQFIPLMTQKCKIKMTNRCKKIRHTGNTFGGQRKKGKKFISAIKFLEPLPILT